jgi:hypothetical protein
MYSASFKIEDTLFCALDWLLACVWGLLPFAAFPFQLTAGWSFPWQRGKTSGRAFLVAGLIIYHFGTSSLWFPYCQDVYHE